MRTRQLLTTVCVFLSILSKAHYNNVNRVRALPESALRTANFGDFNNVAVLHYEQAPNKNPPEDPSVNVPVNKMPLVETNLHVS